MRVSVDQLSTRGFLLERRRGPRNPTIHLTDTDFADDIALISSRIEDAQCLLNFLESASNCIGLYLDELKTEYLSLNLNDPKSQIKTVSGVLI